MPSRCKRVSCGVLPHVPNGLILNAKDNDRILATYGVVLRFGCYEGYYMMGNGKNNLIISELQF